MMTTAGPKSDDEAMAARLIEAMEERGLTKTNLADLTDLNKSQITRYLQGERRPGLDNMERLAEALGKKPAELFPWYSSQKAALLAREGVAAGIITLEDVELLLTAHEERLAEGRESSE